MIILSIFVIFAFFTEKKRGAAHAEARRWVRLPGIAEPQLGANFGAVKQVAFLRHHKQQCLYFLPLPHGHGSFLPTFRA